MKHYESGWGAGVGWGVGGYKNCHHSSDYARFFENWSPQLLSQVFTQQLSSKPVPVKQILVKPELDRSKG